MGQNLRSIVDSLKSDVSLLIMTSSYSDVSWEEIRSVYEPLLSETCIQPKHIPEHDLQNLEEWLSKTSRQLGRIHSGKEAKRLFYFFIFF